jgi:hypothetical protein
MTIATQLGQVPFSPRGLLSRITVVPARTNKRSSSSTEERDDVVYWYLIQ